MEFRKTLVIWNPSAGTASQAEEIYRELSSDQKTEILIPQSREESIQTVRERAADFDRIIAAGGDGTVNAVVAGVVAANADAVIGVLPLGSGNDLARSLEMSLDPAVAWEQLDRGEDLRRLDVLKYRTASASGICVNMLTGGNTGRYLNSMTDEMKKRWGPLCYLRGVVDVLRDMETYHMQLTYANGGSESFEAVNFFLANGRTSGGGLTVSPDARLDDGLCELVIVQEGTPSEIAGLAAEYVVSSLVEHDLVVTRRVGELILSADHDMPLTADGESIGNTPLRVKLQPRTVHMIAGFTASPPVPAVENVPQSRSSQHVFAAARRT